VSPLTPSKPQLRDAPTVFICHASEDKEYAAGLYRQMEAKGLKPWLDKENLRGGVLWDNQIQRAIREIDYFIVLNSKALLEKDVGYVNKEIAIAQERQPEFRERIFIIPVQIDNSPLLRMFEPFQAIDLRDPSQAEKLFNVIWRDHQIRKR
jgi:hypothetical protein